MGDKAPFSGRGARLRATATPEALLRSLIEKFDAKNQRLIRSIRSAMRRRLPTANELVYDYRTFFVISYGATDRGIESIVTTAARPDGMRLYLMHGPRLPDPKKLLTGSGKQARFLRLESARQLAHPDVEALIAAAIDLAGVPLSPKGRGKLIIKSNAAKPRPRRKSAK